MTRIVNNLEQGRVPRIGKSAKLDFGLSKSSPKWTEPHPADRENLNKEANMSPKCVIVNESASNQLPIKLI